MFGSEVGNWRTLRLQRLLARNSRKGIYLLEPEALGVEKHMKLSRDERKAVCNEVYRIIIDLNRPCSAPELVEERLGNLGRKTTKYELAQILKEDSRFVDLGRQLFQVKGKASKREFIKDIICQTLKTQGRPLTIREIYLCVNQKRSASREGFKQLLEKIPNVQKLTNGLYGLRNL